MVSDTSHHNDIITLACVRTQTTQATGILTRGQVKNYRATKWQYIGHCKSYEGCMVVLFWVLQLTVYTAYRTYFGDLAFFVVGLLHRKHS